MMDLLIPKAFAQGAKTAADAASSGTASGVTGLFGYVAANITNWIAGVIVIVLFWMAGKMAANRIKETMLRKRDDIQESALILVERITKITIVTIGITIAFAINGLNFTAVIGAFSLGIGFALKGIIENFISSIIMLSQKYVSIGDFIQVGPMMGTIISIDTRVTVLQGLDGSEIVIPNEQMLSQTLISYTKNPFRRIDLQVGVDYKTNLPMVTSLIKGVLEKDKDIVPKPESLILVDAFGDSSITITIRFWVESSANWQKIRSNLANRLKMAFDEVGVSIPFPIRTLKLDDNDRAFLSTMDSLKKGIVPDKAKVPSMANVAAASLHTENAAQVPYSAFQETAHTQAAEPAKEPAPVPLQETKIPVAAAAVSKPTPPPSHL